MCFNLAPLVWGQTGSIEWKPVEDILERRGVNQDASLQVLFPRTDLNVVVKGTPLEPEGLTSWFVFRPQGKNTLLVGDMVLLDTEVPKATAQALRNGLEITALYSPLLDESPGIKRLRVRGKGAKSNLAWAVKLILTSTGTPIDPPVSSLPQGKAVATANPTKGPQPSLGWSKTEAILGSGEIKGRTIQFEFSSMEATPGPEVDMDLAATLFLQKTTGGHVAGMGTFIMGDEEASNVMETLTQHHITVTSFRNQGSKEEPKLFFLNFWVAGNEKEVAEGLKEALDQAGLSEKE
jgi:hypothetical protein